MTEISHQCFNIFRILIVRKERLTGHNIALDEKESCGQRNRIKFTRKCLDVQEVLRYQFLIDQEVKTV